MRNFFAIQLWIASEAEGASGSRPFAVARRYQVGDDAADILLLRRIIVRTGMVTRHRHGPGLMTGVEIGEEAGSIVDVQVRIEHRRHRREGVVMVEIVDLHAAKVDQLLAVGAILLGLGLATGALIVGARLLEASGEYDRTPMDHLRAGLIVVFVAAVCPFVGWIAVGLIGLAGIGATLEAIVTRDRAA